MSQSTEDCDLFLDFYYSNNFPPNPQNFVTNNDQLSTNSKSQSIFLKAPMAVQDPSQVFKHNCPRSFHSYKCFYSDSLVMEN